MTHGTEEWLIGLVILIVTFPFGAHLVYFVTQLKGARGFGKRYFIGWGLVAVLQILPMIYLLYIQSEEPTLGRLQIEVLAFTVLGGGLHIILWLIALTIVAMSRRGFHPSAE